MNKLDYAKSDENGLSFTLLVDDTPLGALVGARDTAIPHWIIEDDLPLVGGRRIVTVCSCGEYGCGHTNCRVIRSESLVVFQEFDLDCSPEGHKKVFTFSRANYDDIIGRIATDARDYRGSGWK